MTRKILLADDSVTIQKVVELTFLEQDDVEVVAVGTGNEALERFDDVSPALVIADVHMPGADGLEVCRQVKQRRPSTPVLLLVGTFEPFDDAAVAASGAQGHLKKPFDSQELLRVSLDLIGTGPDGGSTEATEGETMTEPEDGGAVMPEDATEAAPDAVSGSDDDAGSHEEAATAPAAHGDGQLSDADVERIAKRVVELMSDKAVRDIAWEVVPDLAELLIRDRLRELESQAD